MTNIETSNSSELGELFSALSKAQGKISTALKDKKNPFFKSSYADLTSVWDACRDPLYQNGLAVIQTIEGTKDDMFLNTWLGHSSGQWMKSKLPLTIIPESKKNKQGDVIGFQITPQGIGSAITYARRYALSALVGICADDDDDGEKAMARKSSKESKTECDEITQNPFEDEKKLCDFITYYPIEEHEMTEKYIKAYCAYWKKGISQAITDLEKDKEKFEKDYGNWKKKEIANKSNVDKQSTQL